MGAYAQCFTPVWTRSAYQSMLIYVSVADLRGNNLQAGDEIGVFDNDVCVGVGVLTEELTETSDYLEIETSRGFLWWPGFTPGDTISYRFCSGGEVVNNRVLPTYIDNGPVFVANGSCIVELHAINTAPTVLSDPLTEARPGVAYSYTVIAEDIDGDSLTYTALALPGWLSFNPVTHTLCATPGEQDVGDQHVNIRISDGDLHTDHTFILSVSNANHAPVFTSEPPTSAVVGDAYTYSITAQDIDGDELIYSAPVLPDWMIFNSDSLVISGVPDSSDIGRNDVCMQVSDGTVTAEQNFPVFVKNVNTPPSFTSTPVTSIAAGNLYVYTAEAEDADGDELSYSVLSLPDWLSFDVNTHNLYGVPSIEDTGHYQISLWVSDGEGSDNQYFVISVEVVSGLEDLSSEEGILIYPNPTEGIFCLVFSREPDKEVNMEIVDAVGKVLSKEVFPPNLMIHNTYDLSYSCPGIHFIRIYDDSFQTIRKLIIK